jgi:HlyD family secretion protein
MQLPWIGKKDRRTPWVIGLVGAGLVAISGGTYVAINRSQPKSDISNLTVAVETKNLTVRITASGNIVPFQTVNISPKTAGVLRQLLVEQGDKVEQGQIIARMDDTQLQAQLLQAKASIAQAQAQLDKLRAGSRREDIAQARARLAAANAQLAEAQAGSRVEDIAQARSRLAAAQAQLDEAKAGSRPEDIAQARSRLAQAQAQLSSAQTANPQQIAAAQARVQAAQAKLDLANQKVKLYSENLVRQGAITRERAEEVRAEANTAQANLLEAQRNLAQVQKGTSPAEIAQRQAAVNEAQQALALVQNGTRPEIIAQRQAAVNEAKQALAELQNGTRPEVIAQRQAAVKEAQQAVDLLVNGSRPEEIAQAEAAVAEARGRLQAIQVQIDDTIIRAPFAGTITQKYANAGAFVTPTTSAASAASATSSSIVAIARGLEVLARVPEVDIGQIKPNQAVEIVADAYSEQVFKGRVRLIAPEAVVDQNVTSFQVRVLLDTGLEQLRSGMNADLTFLGQELPNALVVPTVAIVTEKASKA